MWSYAQWTMERMCGIWTTKVKLRSAAARNLSISLWRGQQLAMFKYAAHLDKRGRCIRNSVDLDALADENDEISHPGWMLILSLLCPIQQDIEEEISKRVCSSKRHEHPTLHHPATAKQSMLSRIDTDRLRLYLKNVLDVDESDLPIEGGTFQGKLWKKCLLNDVSVEQALYRAYIRSARFEDAAARDSTYVQFDFISVVNHRNGTSTQSLITRFGRIQYYLVYPDHEAIADGADKQGNDHFIAMIQEIETEEIDTGGLSGQKLYRMVRTADRTAARFRYFINVDHIRSLVAVVVHGRSEYFTSRNSCFF